MFLSLGGLANIYFLHAIKVCIFKRKLCCLCGFWYLNRARKRNTVTGTLHFFQPRDIDVCLCRSNPPRKNKASDRHRDIPWFPWFPYGDKIAEYSWLMIDYENPWCPQSSAMVGEKIESTTIFPMRNSRLFCWPVKVTFLLSHMVSPGWVHLFMSRKRWKAVKGLTWIRPHHSHLA